MTGAAGLDLVVIGDVLTMDPTAPRVGAVGIRAGRVVALGDLRDVRSALPDRASELRVDGVAVPGFIDSHAHVLWLGRGLDRVQLTGVRGIGEIQARLAAQAAARPDGTWLEADGDFDEHDLTERRLPSATELDAACPRHPVFIDRRGHDALVNGRALREAGITAATPDPAGGRIDRGADGHPSGLLVEHPAVALVRAAIPEPDEATRVARLLRAQEELRGHGICTVVDPAVAVADLGSYISTARQGRLLLRTVVMPLGDADTDDATLDRAVLDSGLQQADPDRLRRGPTKLFLDGGGSLGTALLSDPWPGTDGYQGHQTLPRAVLLAHCAAAAAAGRGVGVHAVGDAAVDLTLDVLDEVARRTPLAGLGFHLIHAYLDPRPEAMRTAARLGVPVSAHPALQWSVGAELVRRLGVDRAARTNPLRNWLDAGVLVGGGSDSPGPSPSVLHGMWQARTRRVRGLDQPLGPEQAVSAAEALALFTTGAAAVAAVPGAGVLEVGGPADLALLDVDPLGDADALAEGRVVATVVAGSVHENH